MNDQLIIDRVKQAERERVLRLMAEALRAQQSFENRYVLRNTSPFADEYHFGTPCEWCYRCTERLREVRTQALAAFDALGLEAK